MAKGGWMRKNISRFPTMERDERSLWPGKFPLLLIGFFVRFSAGQIIDESVKSLKTLFFVISLKTGIPSF
jgi:hypothetical protein